MRNRVFRKVQRLRGVYNASMQKNVLRNVRQTYVSIFFDFEGKYSLSERHGPCLDALGNILELLDNYSIKATFNTVGKLAIDIPSTIQDISKENHEIAGHSFSHEVLTKLTREELVKEVTQTKKVFSAIGIDIKGFRSPQSAWDTYLMKILQGSGYLWNAENGQEKFPYKVIEKHSGALWRFPIAGDDFGYIRDKATPDEMFRYFKSKIESLNIDQRFISFGFHPWILNEPERMSAFRDILELLTDNKEYATSTFSEVLNVINGLEQP